MKHTIQAIATNTDGKLEEKGEKNLRPMHQFCYISGNKGAFLLLIFAKDVESIWPLFSALAISTPEIIRPEMENTPKTPKNRKSRV